MMRSLKNCTYHPEVLGSLPESPAESAALPLAPAEPAEGARPRTASESLAAAFVQQAKGRSRLGARELHELLRRLEEKGDARSAYSRSASSSARPYAADLSLPPLTLSLAAAALGQMGLRGGDDTHWPRATPD